MDTELSPNLCAWISALHVTGREKFDLSPVARNDRWPWLLEEAEIAYRSMVEIAGELPGEVETLRLFSELLRMIGGSSEPLTAGLPQEVVLYSVDMFERDLLTVIDEGALGRYILAAELSWAENDLRLGENSSLNEWWSVPTYLNGYGTRLPNLFRAAYLFKKSLPLIGGLPHDTILCEDSALEFAQRLGRYVNLESVPDERRVCRIKSGEDFIRLVESYPATATAQGRGRPDVSTSKQIDVVPDWKRVGEQFDAVSVDCRTYLTASWRPLSTSYGFTRISGWVPEAVYLLRSQSVHTA